MKGKYVTIYYTSLGTYSTPQFNEIFPDRELLGREKNRALSFKMAATTEATCMEANSSSEKDSSCLKKQEENEGRRMVFFRKVMRRCLDKIMAAGRWVQKTV